MDKWAKHLIFACKFFWLGFFIIPTAAAIIYDPNLSLMILWAMGSGYWFRQLFEQGE